MTHLALIRSDAAAGDPAGQASDATLVAWVREGGAQAGRAAGVIYGRHAAAMRRVVARILGVTAEIDDVLHDSFMAALRRIDSLRDPAALKPWLVSVAVGEARHHLRAKARRAWLSFFAPEDVPDAPAVGVDAAGSAAVRATYEVLRSLPADERIAFALRHLDGMELAECASVCAVSLATFKRRLQRADAAFAAGAREHPALDAYSQNTQSTRQTGRSE